MPADTTTASELTREQVAALLVQPLEDTSIFPASGPRIFDTDGSPVRVPKFTGRDEPSWDGQNELIDEVEASFDEITLLPDSMASVKSLTRFSNELARQSIISLDAALRARMVRDVATKLDAALIAATAAQTPTGKDTPVGLLNYPGVQTIDLADGILSLDDLHDAEGLALGAFIDPSRLRWWMRPETFVALRKLKDGQNRYQIQPDPTAEGAYRLLGHRVVVTQRIPDDLLTTTVVLADMSQIAVARDLAPSVKLLDQTFGHYDQQAIRVVARYDAKPLNPDAVILLTNVDTDGTA